MGKRRMRGVQKDKHGVWWAQLPAGPDGRRPRRKAKTEAEAEALFKQMEAERAAGRDLSRRAETVRELLDDTIEAVAPQVKASTEGGYRRYASRVCEHIGAMKIDAVTFEQVQRVANKLAAEGLSAGYVRDILAFLHTAYDRVIPERVSRNPVDWKKLTLRKVARAERRPVPDDQVRRLLVAGDDLEARGADYRLAPAWWLIALLGTRRGETCGATWRDLDWERGTLTIRQQLAPAKGGGYDFGPPKSAAGVRTLYLGPRLLGRLRPHWELQQAERRRLGPAWKEHGLILCRDDGRPYTPTFLNTVLGRVAIAAGVPHVFPHQLRHTVATALDEEGFSEVVIRAILGHEKGGSVSLRYRHATERAIRRALETVEDRILGAAVSAAREAL